MKPNENHRALAVNGAADTSTFGISFKDEVHLMGILRDTLYSDKILAVLREYSANAWDAHRSVGKGDVPIKVTLPTWNDSTLTIRDFGPGLSHEDVFTVYTQYGASTKRGNDDTVGMLGIGSKSAFAYADTFTISSWHAGTKRVYIAVLDDTGRGVINLVHEGSCDESETGVEIKIAVKNEDIREFTRKAETLFEHFNPRPDINTTLPELPKDITVLVNGSITPAEYKGDGGEWVGIMGCVPYRINLDQLPTERLNKCLRNLNGTLKFDIGTVQIAASREELKYSNATKEALIAKFDALIDEYVAKALELVETDTISALEKRLRMMVLDDLGLIVPEEWESFAKVRVTLVDPLTTPFTMTHNKAAVASVTVAPKIRFLIDDTGKSLRGYPLSLDDYVVKGKSKKTDVKGALDRALAACNLTGAPIILLSSLPWAPFRNGRGMGAVKNVKHKVQTFVLVPRNGYSSPYSAHWEVVDRVPEPTDVFVIIENFKAKDYADFYVDYVSDCLLAKHFGGTVPTVYGYKSTEKKPKVPSDCEGKTYASWRKTLVPGLLTDANKKILVANQWNRAFRGSISEKQLEKLTQDLGKGHPIVALLEEAAEAAKITTDIPRHVISNLEARVGLTDDPDLLRRPAARVEAVNDRYPLLRHARGIASLWGYGYYSAECEEWIEYVKMVDLTKTLPQPHFVTTTVSEGESAHV